MHAAEAKPTEAAFVITNAGEYWNLPEAEKQRPQPIRMELLVYYYDPRWNLLWGECNGAGCYLYVRGRDLGIRAGYRVRIEGSVVPAAGIDPDHVKITVLSEKAALSPLRTDGLLADADRLDVHWVSSEGLVCLQNETDPTHLRLELLSEDRVVTVNLLLGDNEPVPQLVNSRVRVNYVYVATRDLNGQLRKINGWIPNRSDIAVLGWLHSDPRFSRAITPIDALGGSAPDEWLHIAGEIRAREAGQSVTIRDATGQITILTEQPLAVQPGEAVEAIGRVVGRNLDLTLRDVVLRPGKAGRLGSDLGRADPMLKLRLAEQVTALRPEEAGQHYPAFLRGVVTWSDPKANFFFLQDASGGIRVQRGNRQEDPPLPGSQIAILGVSVNGAFAPEIELKELNFYSPSLSPAARVVNLEQAMIGAEEATRVEMRGYLRSVERAGMWQQLNLTTGTGEFTAYLSPDPTIEALVGASVRVTGVCSAVANAQRQLTGIRLWLANAEAVQVEEATLSDPFSAPARTIDSLRQFVSVHALDRQVRVSGTVIYNRPGQYLYLQDRDAGLLVFHRDTAPIKRGEWVEVVGLPGREGTRFVLREGIWRRAERNGPDPIPLAVKEAAVLMPEADGRLVTVRGAYQDKISEQGGYRLIFQAGVVRFEARYDASDRTVLPKEGSLVELTGVYALEYDETRRPRAFRLQLRDDRDFRVLRAPPWWTTRRALTVAGALGLCALLAVAAVVILRRRVKQQTEQIRAQVENEARLNSELERATRLESLGVLAGGIAHDFNNLLTVIMANLGLAAMDDRVRQAAGDVIADAERGARRAAELTQQLLTFAKGGDPVRRAVALADVVRESAEFARHGSRVRCDFDFDPDLPAANVDRGQISRVVHNLVLNATQAMADGGVIKITLAETVMQPGQEMNLAAGRYVKLSVADDGPGIAPEHLTRIFEPYFSTKPKNNGLGLATVHSIIKKHQGQIRVESKLGHGTTFHIWLPVATEAPVATAAAPAAPCLAAVPLRVLFMDDEEVIRRAATSIFRQLGHSAKIVPDGADVIREYEAAMQAGHRYDVVILDLTVPGGLGGRAAMEGLRRLDPNVRAIVSSGYSNDPVLANFREHGFVAVVPKPYKIEDLARTIQDVSRGRPKVDVDHPLAV